MTRLRRLCAAVVIFGALAPSGAGAAAAMHEFLEHGSFAGVDAVSLSVLFHGHRHAPGAPDHDHTLVKPSSPARVVDRRPALQTGCECYAVVPAPNVETVSFAFERSVLATGSGPPPGISPLRV